MTVADLIKGSLRKLGVIATGETPEAAELEDGLSALNALLDSWSLERLLVYDVARQTHALVASQTSFSIGSSGDFNVARPNRIDVAGLILSGQTFEYPVKILTASQYQQWADKATTGTPYAIWYEASYPLGAIVPLPVPSAADTLVLYTWSAISRFPSTSTVISLPPGYELALTLELRNVLADDYGKDIKPSWILDVNEAKAAIKTLNEEPMEMSCDSALSPRTGAYFIDSSAFRSGI